MLIDEVYNDYINLINFLYNYRHYSELSSCIKTCADIIYQHNTEPEYPSNTVPMNLVYDEIDILEEYANKLNKLNSSIFIKHTLLNFSKTRRKTNNECNTLYYTTLFEIQSKLLTICYYWLIALRSGQVSAQYFNDNCPFKKDNKIYIDDKTYVIKDNKTYEMEYYFIKNLSQEESFSKNKDKDNNPYVIYAEASNTEVYLNEINNFVINASKKTACKDIQNQLLTKTTKFNNNNYRMDQCLIILGKNTDDMFDFMNKENIQLDDDDELLIFDISNTELHDIIQLSDERSTCKVYNFDNKNLVIMGENYNYVIEVIAYKSLKVYKELRDQCDSLNCYEDIVDLKHLYETLICSLLNFAYYSLQHSAGKFIHACYMDILLDAFEEYDKKNKKNIIYLFKYSNNKYLPNF